MNRISLLFFAFALTGLVSSSCAGPPLQNDENARATGELAPQLIDAVLGRAHGCALFDDGRVYCWGSNQRGQLGDGTLLDSDLPVTVHGLDDAAQIAASADSTCARTTQGQVRCWGDGPPEEFIGRTARSGNQNSQSGIRTTPYTVVGPGHELSGVREITRSGAGQRLIYYHQSLACLDQPLMDVVDLSVREHNYCARLSTGALLCWGSGGRDSCPLPQIGISDLVDGSTPVPGLPVGTSFSQGADELCIVTEDHELFCRPAAEDENARHFALDEKVRFVRLRPPHYRRSGICIGTLAGELRCEESLEAFDGDGSPQVMKWPDAVEAPRGDRRRFRSEERRKKPGDCPPSLAYGDPNADSHITFRRGHYERTIHFDNLEIGRWGQSWKISFPNLELPMESSLRGQEGQLVPRNLLELSLEFDLNAEPVTRDGDTDLYRGKLSARSLPERIDCMDLLAHEAVYVAVETFEEPTEPGQKGLVELNLISQLDDPLLGTPSGYIRIESFGSLDQDEPKLNSDVEGRVHPMGWLADGQDIEEEPWVPLTAGIAIVDPSRSELAVHLKWAEHGEAAFAREGNITLDVFTAEPGTYRVSTPGYSSATFYAVIDHLDEERVRGRLLRRTSAQMETQAEHFCNGDQANCFFHSGNGARRRGQSNLARALESDMTRAYFDVPIAYRPDINSPVSYAWPVSIHEHVVPALVSNHMRVTPFSFPLDGSTLPPFQATHFGFEAAPYAFQRSYLLGSEWSNSPPRHIHRSRLEGDDKDGQKVLRYVPIPHTRRDLLNDDFSEELILDAESLAPLRHRIRLESNHSIRLSKEDVPAWEPSPDMQIRYGNRFTRQGTFQAGRPGFGTPRTEETWQSIYLQTTIDVTYLADEIHIVAENGLQGRQEQRLALPPNTFAYEQLEILLAALPIEVGLVRRLTMSQLVTDLESNVTIGLDSDGEPAVSGALYVTSELLGANLQIIGTTRLTLGPIDEEVYVAVLDYLGNNPFLRRERLYLRRDYPHHVLLRDRGNNEITLRYNSSQP